MRVCNTGISNEVASTLVMCRTPMIDTEKGKWEKVILSLLSGLRDLNMFISLSMRLDARSSNPWLFRFFYIADHLLTKCPMS